MKKQHENTSESNLAASSFGALFRHNSPQAGFISLKPDALGSFFLIVILSSVVLTFASMNYFREKGISTSLAPDVAKNSARPLTTLSADLGRFENLIIGEDIKIGGDLYIKGEKLIIPTFTAGEAISIDGTSDITISNIGVTSFQEQTGDLKLTAGTGITIDGLTITNNAPNAIQNTFEKIKVSNNEIDTLFGASSGDDTLTFVAGGNINIASDTTNKKITISSTATGWLLSGSNVYLSDSTYNVGIGTSSPDFPLHVVGPIQSDLDSSNYNGFRVGGLVTDFINTAPIYGLGISDDTDLSSGSGNAVQLSGYWGLQFLTGNNRNLVITSGGNVGIGTTTPDYSLHVAESGAGAYIKIDALDDTYDAGLLLAQEDNVKWQLMLDDDNGSVTNGFTIYDADATGGIGHRLFITQDGNVGIGTTNPLTKLHTIISNTLATGALFSNSDWSSLSAGSGLAIRMGATSGDTYTRLQAFDAGASSPNDLILQADGGNVGIGTVSPDASAKLTLNASGTNRYLTFDHATAGNSWHIAAANNGDDLNFAETGVADGRLYLESGGNIGIGTTDPSRLLELSSTQPILGFSESDASTDNKNWIINPTGETLYYQVVNDAESVGTAYLQIDRTGTTVDYVSIPNGNFGIGTVTPATRLHLTGSTTTGANLQIEFEDSASNDLLMGITAANSFDFVTSGGTTNLTIALATGQIAIPTTGSGAGLLIGGDAQLYRSAADTLALASGDSLNIVNGNILLPTNGSKVGADTSMNYLSFGYTSGEFDINASGQRARINLDTDNDSTTTAFQIYTDAANGTGSLLFHFDEAGYFSVSTNGTAGGIWPGTDVQIYRSAANTLALASGDSLSLVSGNLSFAAASDIIAPSNTSGALDITDGSTSYYTLDTRTTISGVMANLFNSPARTVPDGATSTTVLFRTQSGNITYTGPTQITELQELNVFAGNTLLATNALTIDKATTLRVVAPVESTNLTLTDASAIRIINSSGTPANQYGLYIEDMTTGTADYGIAIAGADTAALWISSAADTTDAANGITFGLSRDTNLYRGATNNLYTDDSLQVRGGTLNLGIADTTGGTLNIHGASSGDTGAYVRFYMSADHDTTDENWVNWVYQDDMYWSLATTGSMMRLDNTGRLNVTTTGSSAGVAIGGDTLLYRSAADTLALASGDSLYVVNGGGGAVSIGAAANAGYGVYISNDFSYGSGEIHGLKVGEMTLTQTSAGGSSVQTASFGINSSIVINSGVAHTLVSNAYFSMPSITETSGSVTSAANVYIEGAPTAGDNNYAFWIDAGNARFDGSVGIGDTSPSKPLSIGGTGSGNGISLGDDQSIPALIYRSGTIVVGTEKSMTAVDGAFAIGAFPTENTTGLCWDNSGDSAVTDCNGAPTDLAELYGTSDPSIEAADIVVSTGEAQEILDPSEGKHTSRAFIAKSTAPYQGNLLGVISTNPNQVYGEDGVFTESDNPRPVSLAGRVPVKVSTENGPIKTGDAITSSSTPGVGMRATKAGRIVGTALQSYNGEGIGSVIVFVNPSYFLGTAIAQSVSDDPLFSLLDSVGTLNAQYQGQILSSDQVQKLIGEQATVLGISTEKTSSVSAQLASLTEGLGALEANLTAQEAAIASISATLANLPIINLAQLATGSAVLGITIVEEDFAVSGNTTLANLSTIGNITVANNLTLASTSINTIGEDLQIQPLKQGNVSFMNGLVIIDTTGNVVVTGKISVETLETDQIIITTTPTNKKIGVATLPAGQTFVTINTTALTADSKILLTPKTTTYNQVLFVSDTQIGENFIVNIDEAQTTDIEFNWFILDSKEEVQP